MNISVEQVYTSVACNRTPEIVDWNSDGLICYGANNAVVIYDLKNNTSDPLTVLSHHRSRVNSVKWIYKPDNTCTELISCSADKTAALWTVKSGVWKVTSELIGHTDGVSCVFGVYTGDDLTLYTASIDSTIRVWKKCNGEITHQQSINLSSGLCLTLHACLLPAVNKPVLFAALDDHKIHVFSGDEYHRVHTLVGHEDWVRGLDVMRVVDDTTLLLASASQDTYIRIWSIQAHCIQEPVAGIKVEEKVFQAHGQNWAIKLDAVLAGHEGWVYGVQWQPGVKDSKPIHRLLSSSLDKTLIIWEPESAPTRGEGDGQGVWTERVRVGEVGGNGLGFYGSRFEPGGDAFMGHGYNGSFHIWRLCKETKQWQPAVVPGGHFSAVEDVRWEPQGRYLVSVSADQTTRVHAPWTTTHGAVQWHEIARPQVHGYDMSSLAILSPTTFASSAEEKVIRVFKAPHNFVQNFQNICKEVLVEGETGGPEGASVPSLGLSNKAVFNADEGQEVDDDNDGYFTPLHLIEPLTEETLMQNTLWPETQKLYGHGYEVFALDASADGALLASACKATVAEHAAVIIWNTTSWEQVQKLVSHTLTVTQLAFSPDSRHLLSVSRDRKWTLYQRKQDSDSFAMVASTDKTNGVHTRIIWCCAWAHDGQVFGTGSRDGKVCIWSKAGTTTESSLGEYGLLGKPLEVPNASITAVTFAPILLSGARVLAAGFESGHIRIYSYDTGVWKQLTELDNSAGHHLTVKRLTFRPREVATSKDQLLASCGTDNLVRIHRIVIS